MMEKATGTREAVSQPGAQNALLGTLLNHISALTSIKDAKSGRYLVCNQAFAGFAGGRTPEETAGRTDAELFPPACAARTLENDRRALEMDAPFVLLEDVADAAGQVHRFRTARIISFDEAGRKCIVGISEDITELEAIKREREQARADYRKAMRSGAAYEEIVDALSDDYFNLYYVDLETDEFIEYGSRTDAEHSAAETRGTDFFNEAKKNALVYLYEEDQQRFISALDKETLTAEIEKYGSFTMNYRLLVDGVPTYVSLKATRGSRDGRHIVIGVNNIDSQMKDRAAARRAEEDRKAYRRFSALNNNLIVLYLVDPLSGHFDEFTSSGDYARLEIEKEGEDFFRSALENSRRVVHPEDQQLFMSQFTKENLLNMIERDGMFVLDYRLLIGGLPSYVRLKASKFEEDGKTTLIIGLLDEDAQIRQEKKIVDDLSAARRLATIDGLTGVKNKYAYSEAEKRIDRRIEEGSVSAFTVVVFDLNDLKLINDTRGHDIGDEYIKNACKMICTCFKHSPVFRIGGDEFAAILEGEDYINQEGLLERFEKQVLVNMDKGRSVVAFGSARFDPKKDKDVRSVFERADSTMYKEKMLLKNLRAASEETDRQKPKPDFGDISENRARRHILIADDVESNRDILGDLLRRDYELMFASDGAETMEILKEHKDEIALVILDLYMPNMSGREVMTAMQVDEELMFIPVIFISVDLDAERDCLKIGAMDFIPKPYPDVEVIKARIDRCIELSENRDLIRRTQKDRLTGLFNTDYFLRYVDRYDRHYRELAFDAVVCDVNQFFSLTEQYGTQFGNLVLRSIGLGISKLARKTGGIGCRREGDTFLLYCPHQDDYDQLLSHFIDDLFYEEELASKVSVRFGVYTFAQEEPDIEERFTCAELAADRAGKGSGRLYGMYQ